MKQKYLYRAWSQIRAAFIYVHAYSEDQAYNLIRRKVQSLTGRFDSDYNIEKM